MPRSKPFVGLLAVGVLCSLTGFAFAWLPGATSAAQQEPASDSSAFGTDSSGPSNAVPTVVTEASPASTEPFEAVAVVEDPGAPPAPSAEPDPVSARPDPPSASPATAIAHVAATPTAVPVDVAPPATVQAMPASIEQPVDLVRSPDKARGLLEAMNEARRAEGLAALEWDASLEEVAYARAANLVQHGYFDHYAPDGESAFSELAARGIRYRLAGENLARNNYLETKTVAAAFDGLMNSTGHRANILEARFTSAAVACIRDGKMWIYVTVFLN